MAFEGQQPVMLTGAIAGSGIDGASAQFKFVKFSADNTVVLCDAVTDVPCGVLQAPATAGQAVTVVALGETKLQADTSLSAGNLIGPSADGQAALRTPGTDTTKYICGQVANVGGATTAGTYLTALVNCLSPARAA